MLRRLVILFLLASVVGSFVGGASHASSMVTLAGTVKDNTGAAVTGAEVQVLSPGTASVVGSALTDTGGSYQLSIAPGTYDVKAVPPAGSGFQPTVVLSRDITADTTLNFVLVPAGMARLSGRVLDGAGNGVPGQSVNLSPTGGSTTTDASGAYSFEVAPGDYQVTVERSGNAATLNVPQNYQLQRHSPVLSLTQDTVLDLQLPAHRVSVHVQDPAGNPVSGVGLTAGIPLGGGVFCCSFITVSGLTFERAWSFYGSPITTDASGDAVLWLFSGPSGGDGGYTLTGTPTPASPFFAFSLLDVEVTADTSLVVSLQFSNATAALGQVASDLEAIAAGNPGTALADKVEDANAKVEVARAKLAQGDRQGALGELEGATGDLQAAVNAGLLSASEGNDLMNAIAAAARLLAAQAIAEAEASGGDPVKIAAAKAALADGDAKRAAGAFKDAVANYKDAVARAESA